MGRGARSTAEAEVDRSAGILYGSAPAISSHPKELTEDRRPRRSVYGLLEEVGARRAEVQFNGGYGESDLMQVKLFDSKDELLAESGWYVEPSAEDGVFAAAAHQVAVALDNERPDWTSEEGSEGVAVIDVKGETTTFDYQERYMDSDHHPFELDHIEDLGSRRGIFNLGKSSENEETLPKVDVYAKLKEAGIGLVEIEFDGHGDEGNINSVSVYDTDGKRNPDADPDAYNCYGRLDGSPAELAVLQAEEGLSRNCGSWGDNEGSWGTVTIDVAKEKTVFDYNPRSIKSSDRPFSVGVMKTVNFDGAKAEIEAEKE